MVECNVAFQFGEKPAPASGEAVWRPVRVIHRWHVNRQITKAQVIPGGRLNGRVSLFGTREPPGFMLQRRERFDEVKRIETLLLMAVRKKAVNRCLDFADS